jgi:hypothetical protein
MAKLGGNLGNSWWPDMHDQFNNREGDMGGLTGSTHLLLTIPHGRFEQQVTIAEVLSRRAMGAVTDHGPRSACTGLRLQKTGELLLDRNGVRTASTVAFTAIDRISATTKHVFRYRGAT